LKQLLVSLLSHPGSATYPTAEQLCGMLAPRILLELDQAQEYSDVLETELGKELENGRLFRLLVKLDLIELAGGDPVSWHEVLPIPPHPHPRSS
jgi:PAB-dependent poly(A)-specific ribonuclease subunit 3